MGAFIKFYRGNYSELQKMPLNIGCFYITNEGNLYVDTPAGRIKLESTQRIIIS